MGAHGQLTRGTNWCNPRTKYKRSKIVFAITSTAFSLGHLGARLLELAAQSLIGNPGTILPPPTDTAQGRES